MLFKSLCWVAGRNTFLNEWFSLPVCRVYNDVKSEHYTLMSSGWVTVQAADSGKVTDSIPVSLVSEKLVIKFAKELAKPTAWFKFQCWLAKKDTFINSLFLLPVCRVYNIEMSEHLTLKTDDWVRVQSTHESKPRKKIHIEALSSAYSDLVNGELTKGESNE